MVRMSVLANALRAIINAEKAGKRQVSLLLVEVLTCVGPAQTRLQGCC